MRSVGGHSAKFLSRYAGDVAESQASPRGVPTKRPPFGTLLRRALTLRCAWCGNRPGFRRSWFKRYDACQNCGLSVQRGQEGFELGAATVNAIIVLGALIAAAAVSIVITYPDVAATPLIIVLGAVAIVLPVLLYPFTFTIWFAVELMMDPPSARDLEAARARVAEREAGLSEAGT
jgi:uncharacterized protein (DUF983 family)